MNCYARLQTWTPCPFANALKRLRAEGYRLCHNRSARKHRKQGHHVRYVGERLYAWKVK